MRALALLACLMMAGQAVADRPRAPAAADAIVGFWQVADGSAIVQIRQVGAHYAGRLVWLREARYPPDDPRGIGGQPVTDRHNPDPRKRDRPLLGLTLLTGLNYHVDDNDLAIWRHGKIYDTENGKHYHCLVRLADHEHLKLHGYVGLPLFGKTTIWTRIDGPPHRRP